MSQKILLDGAVKKKQGGGGAVVLVVRQVLAPATCVDSDFLPFLASIETSTLATMGAACGVVGLLDANRPSYFVQYKLSDDLFVFHFYFTRMTPFAEHWTASTPLDLHAVHLLIVGPSISMLHAC